MEVNINVNGMEPVAQALQILAGALAKNPNQTLGAVAKAVMGNLEFSAPIVSTTPAAAPVSEVAPAPAPAPVHTEAQPISPVPASVPVQAPVVPISTPAPAAAPPVLAPVAAAPSYTKDQIAAAGASLVDKGMLNELGGLLQKFQVQSIAQLPKEQYGAFATELRALGANL